ncbi:serine/threonine-protein kinase [Sorangium cellulosum]|uniref:Protein kinase n=1 Tax=Sorangium cellulosum TaxID=56 RepID=A0A150QWI4_SORCE|nr:serine/threonine-protein kinase [Sorangium cellulosum]KYF72397.1 protein kinase [Sorangium cellulosum]
MPLHTGQMVTPALRLVRILRRGGMGSIWVADRLPLKSQVAVKFMSPELADDAGYVERFRREAVAAAQITSPHVTQVLDHGLTAEGMPYIAMELLRGEDLRARIRRLGRLPLGEVARIVAQTAKALGQAHRLGIVHRDIKPDNLFLTEVDGETFVKVLDFGIARRARDMRVTSTGSVVGTPLYMSPEQLTCSKDLDLRADLWALGVVAYHAITGRVPFFAETIVGLTLTVHAGQFTPPSALRPEAPPALDDWMRRALQLDPNARFGSAREMAEALERALSSRRRSAGPQGTATQDTGAEAPVQAPVASAQDTAVTLRHPAPARLPMPLADTDPCEGDAPERTTTVMMTTSSRKKKRPAARIATVAALGAMLAGAGVYMAARHVATSTEGAALAADSAALAAVAVATRSAGLPGTAEATLLASVVDAPRPLLAPGPPEPAEIPATRPDPAPSTEKARPAPKKPTARPTRSPGRTKPAPSAGRVTRRIKPFPRHDIAMHR